jgi:short-subunit dehydrogenase
MDGAVVLFILIILIYVFSYLIYKIYFYFPPIKIEQLRNKRVIITGASRGIGEELAYEYSRYNCRLILAARSIDILKNQVAEKCRQLGAIQVECIQFDASTEESCLELIQKTIEFYRGIDILILNHTASVYQPFFQSNLATNVENMKKLFHTNFFGYFHTSKK